MEEPFPNCLHCKHLLNHIDFMKQTLRMLEQSLETKQERLNIFILNGLMTEAIHHQIRLIEFDRLSIHRLMIDL